MKKQKLTFSIGVPVYKGSPFLKQSLQSILKQSFNNYELLVVDDNPPSSEGEIVKTRNILTTFNDRRIKYIKNEKNLGSQGTIKKIAALAKNEILFYLCQDDILAKDALQKTHDAFFLSNDVGGVTRPFFWFEKRVSNPVRAVLPYDEEKDSILSLSDGEKAFRAIFGSVGQISGLAYRRNCIEVSFHEDIFPGHIYPFAGILKKYKCVFLKDYTVAVRTESSQTRTLSTIYQPSPTESWIKMFNTVFQEKKWKKTKALAVKHIATHYEGLIQLKNFAPKGVLEKEIWTLVKHYPLNLLSVKFWLYVLLTFLTPKKILLFLSDNYKRVILSRLLKKIDFDSFDS
ncbi:glycosyltransferase family 2 protein [Candidatus Roizmanbacteria bacterium]|nr:glycosyltransferase family 2 protein [Candidatus Roizmanbacteria bacterium]